MLTKYAFLLFCQQFYCDLLQGTNPLRVTLTHPWLVIIKLPVLGFTRSIGFVILLCCVIVLLPQRYIVLTT